MVTQVLHALEVWQPANATGDELAHSQDSVAVGVKLGKNNLDNLLGSLCVNLDGAGLLLELLVVDACEVRVMGQGSAVRSGQLTGQRMWMVGLP